MRFAVLVLLVACTREPERDLTLRPVSPSRPPPPGVEVIPPGPERTVLDPVGEAEPATKAAARVLGVLERVEEKLTTTRYQARTQVREREGLYAWDCSGMTSWVLAKAAPKALAAVNSDRPVARDYFRAIERAPTGKPRRGWQRLAGVADARPGDVFAWLRPPHLPRTITGHVGFVLEPPRPVTGLPGAYLVRIADSTRLPHGEDTRADDGIGGYGTGELLFLTDENGVATHYGWFGLDSGGFMETKVLFGRVSK